MGFGVVPVFKVAQDYNPGFGLMRFTILVGLDNEDTHRRYGFWDYVLTSQIEILLFVYLFINVMLFQPILFLKIGIQPDLSIRVGRLESLDER